MRIVASKIGPGKIATFADWTLLAASSLVVAWLRMPKRVPVSWRYFSDAAAMVFGPLRLSGHSVGLRVYELRPGLQFGPLSVIAAEILRVVARSHVVMAAHIVVLAAGLAILWLVSDAAQRTSTAAGLVARTSLLVAGGIFLFEWAHLAIDTLHIDDAIALLGAAAAVNAIARRSAWWWAALAIGAGTAAKPWAIAFLPLLWALPHGRRRDATLLTILVGLGVWAPFVIADSRTLLAAHYTIPIEPGSVLRLVGVHATRTPPWDRLAQLVTALTLGALAVGRRRWPGVVLVAVAARIMLDPSVRTYYTTGLVLGAVIWDLLRPRWTWPILTVALTALLEVPPAAGMAPDLCAALRLLACVLAIVAVVGLAESRAPGRATARRVGWRRAAGRDRRTPLWAGASARA